jgi:hypothetical protein
MTSSSVKCVIFEDDGFGLEWEWEWWGNEEEAGRHWTFLMGCGVRSVCIGVDMVGIDMSQIYEPDQESFIKQSLVPMNRICTPP